MSEQPGRLARTWKQALGGLVALALAADMVANGLLGGNFDETISSRAGRTVTVSAVSWVLCAALDLVQADHCQKAADNRGG